jgi:hypothetical protein
MRNRISIALAMSFAACGAGAKSPVGTQCAMPPDDEVVQLDPTEFGACFDLRDIDTAAVLELTNRSPFASGCPTTITNTMIAHDATACEHADNALKQEDVLRIDDWGDGEMVATLKRGSEFIVDRKPLAPVVVDIGGVKHTIGYKTQATPPGHDSPVDYYIYLGYRADQDSDAHPRVLKKQYFVEVFGKSKTGAKKCEDEKPEPIARIVNCDSLAIWPKETGQLPSGGGGEPPPRPKP